ncbi:EF-P 5-aminopentanol modification-associated protein YfmH [Gracilibacillus alcaliphilus]|uniref:EF-P 5-aminopentanol modification-associated protein YfmH n=1 Tax=Gracilibacillus alcaliphilus TaxID=1401441 RepID=UPI00195EB294|nr:pitrilysin family protein [Gracilibacillus alcaliphilus]MBM7676623.1 putative Zn-dependent peptidase [Gracilibacillus alcaliphilus]
MKHKHYQQIEEHIYSETLDNGLRVYVLPKQEMAKTYAIFTTNYGSIDQSFVPLGKSETETVPDGIAHFLEHKLFEKEDRDVFQDFSKAGASANAFTSFTKTAYLFSATSKINENLTTLIDFVQDPYFSEASVEKEKGIITQEIKMYDDQPDWRAFFGTIKSLYHHHPVQIDIAGTVESIQEITKDDLYTCYHTFYHPSNMVLFIAGNVDADEIMALIKENQAGKEFAPPSDIERNFPEEPQTVADKEVTVKMPVSVPKALVGIKELEIPEEPEQFMRKEWLTDIILDHLFSRSGVAYERLYETGLIDQSFSSENHLDRNFGFCIVGGNTKEPEKLASLIKQELLDLSADSLTAEHFERIKRKKIGQLLRAMNSLEFIANQYSHYQLLNIDFFDSITWLEELTYDDVTAFLDSWITEDQLSVCMVKGEETER